MSLFAAVSDFFTSPPVFLQISAEHHRFFSLLFPVLTILAQPCVKMNF